jgi:hypothetical protein
MAYRSVLGFEVLMDTTQVSNAVEFVAVASISKGTSKDTASSTVHDSLGSR